MNEQNGDQPWLGVIGRSLAFLCLAQADLRDKDLASQAKFLEGLGLPRTDAAHLLGTTVASLGVLISISKRKKRNKHANKKKRK